MRLGKYLIRCAAAIFKFFFSNQIIFVPLNNILKITVLFLSKTGYYFRLNVSYGVLKISVMNRANETKGLSDLAATSYPVICRVFPGVCPQLMIHGVIIMVTCSLEISG